jgi:lysophospholipase L1-like esterase
MARAIGLRSWGAALLGLAALTLAGCDVEESGQSPSAKHDASHAVAVRDTPAIRSALPPSASHRPVQRLAGLGAFYDDLGRLEAGELAHLHIVQLGDSHTAGDVFTGRLRSRFQERYGNAGRGAMPPGKTYPGLRQKEVSVAQSGAWTMLNSRSNEATMAFGISGFLAVSDGVGASMKVTPTDGQPFQAARVDFLHSPGGGDLELWLDDQMVVTVSTDGPNGEPGQLVATNPEGAHTLTVVARSRGIAVADWSIEKQAAGVLVESFGIVGATVRVVDHWSDAVARQEMATLEPSLVILAFGTNEGFENTLNQQDYAATFAQTLDKLLDWAPRTSVLVVGPPDGQRQVQPCRKGKKAPPCRWSRPPNIAVVRALQKRVAEARGVAFWDWSQVMAGPGGINDWVAAEPPLARDDHVHFTTAGYELAADRLFDTLTGGYTSYKVGSVKAPPR